MKQETKELIDWIKKQINLSGECIVAQPNEHWKEDKTKAMNFLDSLLEIEAHLCRGGYIQDKNGTPCCHYDDIRCVLIECPEDGWFYGKLVWNSVLGSFQILTQTNTYTCSEMSWFEKV